VQQFGCDGASLIVGSGFGIGFGLHDGCCCGFINGMVADARWDRIVEAVTARLKVVNGSPLGKFVSSKLGEELRRFHNPTSDKTRRLFLDYLEVDVTAGWKWQHYDPASARKTLEDLLSKRGDAVHRSRPSLSGTPPAAHLLKRDDLEKAIRFLKGLVEATDRGVDDR